MRQWPRIHSFHCSGVGPQSEDTQKTASVVWRQSPVLGSRMHTERSSRFCRDKLIDDNEAMLPIHVQLENSTLRGVLKRLHFPLEVMLMCVRWYAAYPLSLRQLEEMMAERGVFVDHATVHRWALKMLPVLAKVFRHRKHPVGPSWRVDETYVKVAGQWKYLYRAVDKLGQTVDFLLTARRDEAAARRLFERAIDLHDAPEKITIDKSGANTAAVQGLIADSGLAIGGSCSRLPEVLAVFPRALRLVQRCVP